MHGDVERHALLEIWRCGPGLIENITCQMGWKGGCGRKEGRERSKQKSSQSGAEIRECERDLSDRFCTEGERGLKLPYSRHDITRRLEWLQNAKL